MAKAIDLTGMKFGRLTVIERAGSTKAGQARWRCKCECGNNTTVEASHLKRGNVQSCGCLFKEFHNKHGMYGTKFYKVWDGIKNRCFNSNRQDYERYGGRGITICDEWRDNFQAFYDYVSQLPHFNEDGYSLDRIDNNGNYEPGNVRWADNKTQRRNTRKNIFVEYKGVEMPLSQAAELSGIKYCTLQRRYYHGDRGEYLFRPVERR